MIQGSLLTGVTWQLAASGKISKAQLTPGVQKVCIIEKKTQCGPAQAAAYATPDATLTAGLFERVLSRKVLDHEQRALFAAQQL